MGRFAAERHFWRRRAMVVVGDQPAGDRCAYPNAFACGETHNWVEGVQWKQARVDREFVMGVGGEG